MDEGYESRPIRSAPLTHRSIRSQHRLDQPLLVGAVCVNDYGAMLFRTIDANSRSASALEHWLVSRYRCTHRAPSTLVSLSPTVSPGTSKGIGVLFSKACSAAVSASAEWLASTRHLISARFTILGDRALPQRFPLSLLPRLQPVPLVGT